MAIWAVIVAFTVSRSIKLVKKDSPFTSQVDQAIDSDDPPTLDLTESDFKFGVTSFVEKIEGTQLSVQTFDLKELFTVGGY